MYDLVVVGGGVAGSAAAITAARQGASVLLLERESFPRQKVCGEFVSAEALDLLRNLLSSSQRNLLDNAIGISSVRLFIDEKIITAPIPPSAVSIARYDLDVALWKSARESGADTREQSSVTGIRGNGPFQIDCADEQFQARSVINATGRWSKLNRQPNGLPATERWIGIKAHYSEPSPEPSVDLYFFDGGYCGVQPVDLVGSKPSYRVNVSAMVRASVATSLPQVFSQQKALFQRSSSWRQIGEFVATSPLLFHRPACTSENILKAGDASAFVDPFVGDGISLALRSGVLAAQSLDGFFKNATPLRQAVVEYRVVYEKNLSPIFANSSQLRRLLKLPRFVRKPLVHAMSKIPGITQWMMRRTR